MAKSIFVGNLPWTIKNEELQKSFEEFGGVISARVITDKMTGRSRGFGFVDMEDEAADKAIASLNGAELGGRKIIVNEARPKVA